MQKQFCNRMPQFGNLEIVFPTPRLPSKALLTFPESFFSPWSLGSLLMVIRGGTGHMPLNFCWPGSLPAVSPFIPRALRFSLSFSAVSCCSSSLAVRHLSCGWLFKFTRCHAELILTTLA